jgi:D-galactarolactone isomerase
MSEETARPRLKAPPGTTDTHMHVFESRFPLAPTATVQPPEAPISEYRKVCERLGIERCVVVQPSGYGTDNSCTLEAIAAFGPKARGIAVVEESVTDAELERLHKAGIRGLRFHMLPGGVIPWESLPPLAARIGELGWHPQVQLDGRELPERMEMLENLPGTLVIDHTGKFLEPVTPDDPAFRALLDLVEEGSTYVKLSAPYETSKVGLPHFDDVGALAKVLLTEAPERMLWATNWPHLGQPRERVGDEAGLLDLLLEWTTDEATLQRVLVDNPTQLYFYEDTR